ncbi:MAG: glycerate kinase [Rhodothermales bacterium]|nr:glycerate kinase [Rhodothermales bacterium]MBO6781157.1 glycerate kinase [Rhodothermales bacterium]
MTILIAPNAFKESLTAREAAEAIARGARRVRPSARLLLCPVSDGGDGLLQVARDALGANPRTTEVDDPLGRAVRADWALASGTAMIEMALASGLALLSPEERDPGRTTSTGTGQLMLEALHAGASRVLLGIGGSATNDAGMGLATAFGVRFLDRQGIELPPIGRSLALVKDIDGLDGLPEFLCDVVCDVDNPLLGPRGCARVYAAQKGATEAEIEVLEDGMSGFADVVERITGRECRNEPGAGAAGGLGFGLMTFFGARLLPGSAAVLDLVGFDALLEEADVVLTGEGRIDHQTVQGKVPGEVARRAVVRGIPVAGFGGSVAPGSTGFDRTVEINPPGTALGVALCQAALHLENAAARLLSDWPDDALL